MDRFSQIKRRNRITLRSPESLKFEPKACGWKPPQKKNICKWCNHVNDHEVAYGRPSVKCIENLKSDMDSVAAM